MKKNWKNTAHF